MFIFVKNIICNVYEKYSKEKLSSIFIFLIISLENVYRDSKKRLNIKENNWFLNVKRSIIPIMVSFALISSSSSYAEPKENNFFLKSIVTLSKVANVREKHTDMLAPLVQESSIMPAVGVGVGYYVDEDIRIDLILENLRWGFLEQQGNFSQIANEGTGFFMGSRTISRKAYGTSLMLNGYIDIVEVNNYKIFLGLGGGIVQIKEKVNVTTIGSLVNNTMITSIPSHVDRGSSKTARNIAYSLILGTNIVINPQVNVELMYLWRDFGKLKYHENGSFTRSANNAYRGHHLSVGLRYDI